MEKELDLSKDPATIVNGFQFCDDTVRLMAFALDLHRRGASIDRAFFDRRITDDDAKGKSDSILDMFHTNGPRCSRARFDLFETRETCVNNAVMVFDAIAFGFDMICDELLEAYRCIAVKIRSHKLTASWTLNSDQEAISSYSLLYGFFEKLETADQPTQFILPADMYIYAYDRQTSKAHAKWRITHEITAHTLKKCVGIYLNHLKKA